MEEKKILQLYRVQSDNTNQLLGLNQNAPVKRVLISSFGKIEFNPNDKQYVYFSKTKEHHVYYIFNKVISIITDELNKYKKLKIYETLHLPEQLPPYFLYTQAYSNILKNVKDFFQNFASIDCVELITLNYLNEFSNFFQQCATSNKKKKIENTPEIADTNYFGGAYGINDAWLSLLKSNTISTRQAKLSFDVFFDFILENNRKASTCRIKLKRLIDKNPNFLEILNILTYTDLQNPEFKAKNNINEMRKALRTIEKKKLYNPALELSRKDFSQESKIFKEEMNFYK